MNSKKNRSTMRLLGSQVKAARTAAGLTQRRLAERAMVEEETIASVEQGRRRLTTPLARTLDKILDTKGTLEAGVENLPEIDQFPLYAEEYMLHEREAIALSWYDNAVIPGLLQTTEYARAVLAERIPAYDEDEIGAKLAGRIERQEILQRKNPPTMSFVIWEPVLHLGIGAPETRREQLVFLREFAELPGLALQILPMNTAAHAGLDGPFILLETPDHQHLAYAEGQRGSQWVADLDEVSRLARKYAMLRSQALTPQESRCLLDRLLGDQ
ncbi:Scr1 family TA system antitoxin-like transcriptional regulator [Streptomyces sp. NPDC101776]|uniref:helix-turn-helix domain-containing protein n=1 Tax=Streptomyces sp. NPDC101776 TaxID=3366146 RepID=UPI0038113280